MLSVDRSTWSNYLEQIQPELAGSQAHPKIYKVLRNSHFFGLIGGTTEIQLLTEEQCKNFLSNEQNSNCYIKKLSLKEIVSVTKKCLQTEYLVRSSAIQTLIASDDSKMAHDNFRGVAAFDKRLFELLFCDGGPWTLYRSAFTLGNLVPVNIFNAEQSRAYEQILESFLADTRLLRKIAPILKHAEEKYENDSQLSFIGKIRNFVWNQFFKPENIFAPLEQAYRNEYQGALTCLVERIDWIIDHFLWETRKNSHKALRDAQRLGRPKQDVRLPSRSSEIETLKNAKNWLKEYAPDKYSLPEFLPEATKKELETYRTRIIALVKRGQAWEQQNPFAEFSSASESDARPVADLD